MILHDTHTYTHIHTHTHTHTHTQRETPLVRWFNRCRKYTIGLRIQILGGPIKQRIRLDDTIYDNIKLINQKESVSNKHTAALSLPKPIIQIQPQPKLLWGICRSTFIYEFDGKLLLFSDNRKNQILRLWSELSKDFLDLRTTRNDEIIEVLKPYDLAKKQCLSLKTEPKSKKD